MHPLVEKVRPSAQRLLPPGSRVVVGVSGGPDSQALLDLLAELKGGLGLAGLWAFGVDHGLRPEAPKELALAEALARERGVVFASTKVEVPRHGNLAAQARRVRYEALARFAQEVGATHIAVGHTATDQVETVLMRIARGSGIGGAAGIPPKRGAVVRPLLQVSRDEILAYLSERGIPFASDPSNVDLRHTRARVRAKILGELKAINPRLERAVGRFARLARADERFLNQLARRELERRLGPLGSLDTQGLDALGHALASRVIRHWLASYDVPHGYRSVRALLGLVAGGRRSVAIGGCGVRFESDRLWIFATAGPSVLATNRAVPLPGRIELPELGIAIAASVEVFPKGGAQGPALRQRLVSLGGDARAVAFDLNQLNLKLELRPWHPGDWIRPFGSYGRQKVGDLFTNAKVPRALRPRWPLLVHGDEILWVVGLRRGSAALVGPDTASIALLQLEGALPWKSC